MLNAGGAGAGGGGGFDWRVLLSALSSFAPTLANSRASSRSRDELARGRAETAQAQARADRRIGDEVMAIERSDPKAHEQRAAVDYTRAVRQARSQGNASTPANLGGERFRSDTNAATNAVAGEGNRLAHTFARIDAPVRQREGERQSIGNAGTDVRREAGRASSADAMARLRAQNAGRVSPWVQILAQLGSQIANNYQRQDEKTVPDGLELIDLTELPDRLQLPRPVPRMRQMPTFTP